MRIHAYNTGAILEISAMAGTALIDTIERAKDGGNRGQMLDVDEIRAHIETMNQAPRMSVEDLDRAIASQEIQLPPGVLDRVRQSLRTPREPYQLSDRTIAAIERRSLEARPRELKVDKVPEVKVFFWMRRNSGRLANHSEIGAELELPASAVSSAIRYLLDEGLVESHHEPRDLTRYSYRALSLQGVLNLVWPETSPTPALDS